tara:strand:+ start:307 stop:471 length:165 start_codon:yes stop_codon:yes gene_type:complete
MKRIFIGLADQLDEIEIIKSVKSVLNVFIYLERIQPFVFANRKCRIGRNFKKRR